MAGLGRESQCSMPYFCARRVVVTGHRAPSVLSWQACAAFLVPGTPGSKRVEACEGRESFVYGVLRVNTEAELCDFLGRGKEARVALWTYRSHEQRGGREKALRNSWNAANACKGLCYLCFAGRPVVHALVLCLRRESEAPGVEDCSIGRGGVLRSLLILQL